MNWTSWGISKKKTGIWISTCVSIAALLFSPSSQWQIPEVLSHTHAFPSPVTNWICASVYSVDWDLTMTFSERNRSKHLFQSLESSAIPCDKAYCWLQLWKGPWQEKFCLCVVTPFSHWPFPPWPKNFKPAYSRGMDKLKSKRACAFAGNMSHHVPICLSLLMGRTGCWVPYT